MVLTAPPIRRAFRAPKDCTKQAALRARAIILPCPGIVALNCARRDFDFVPAHFTSAGEAGTAYTRINRDRCDASNCAPAQRLLLAISRLSPPKLSWEHQTSCR